MSENWKTAAESITHCGVPWVEIHRASKLSKVGVTALREMIARKAVRAHEESGTIYLPQSTVVRLKQNAASLRTNPQRKLGYRSTTEANRANRPGPHAAREVQDVLPMSSGRAGKGWIGGNSGD